MRHKWRVYDKIVQRALAKRDDRAYHEHVHALTHANDSTVLFNNMHDPTAGTKIKFRIMKKWIRTVYSGPNGKNLKRS